MKHWVLIGLTALALSACAAEKVELQKSPCAGLEGSPCGPKRAPVGNSAMSQPQPAEHA